MTAAIDVFEERARAGDAGFAIAFALLSLAQSQDGLTRAVDRLGCNAFNPTLGPGTTEFIGMQLQKIAEHLEGM